MKTKSKFLGLALAVWAGTSVVYAQPPLEQSVLTFKSEASITETGHHPRWQLLPKSNDAAYLERNKIYRYHGMSSQPWTTIGAPRPSISDVENAYAVQPGINVVSFNF